MACDRRLGISLVVVVVLFQGLWVFSGVWNSGGDIFDLSGGLERSARQHLEWIKGTFAVGDKNESEDKSGSLARKTLPSAPRVQETALKLRSNGGAGGTLAEKMAANLAAAKNVTVNVASAAEQLSGSSATFKMYTHLPMSYQCIPTEAELHQIKCNKCKVMASYITYLETKQDINIESPDFYIVPLDYLATRVLNDPDQVSVAMRVMDAITKNLRYVHFGGSDHIFLCLAAGCDKLMELIIERHPIGVSTRAMWVGVRSDIEALREQWPCPNRVLRAPPKLVETVRVNSSGTVCKNPTEEMLARGVRQLLDLARPSISGEKRWHCSRNTWDLDLSNFKNKNDQGCIKVKKHGMCFAGIPKCASSTMNIVLRRMNNIQGWNDTQHHTHGPKNGLKWASSKHNFDEYEKIFTSTGVLKIAVLRDPAERFFSAYSDKIVKKHEFGRVRYHGTEVPSLDYVVDKFLEVHKKGKMGFVDKHFRPMVFFGSIRHLRYDYVIRVSSLAEDLETLFRSVGLWERFGASGWGINGDQSFMEYKGMNVGKHPPPNVELTPEILNKLYKIYARDYERFGFPKHDDRET